MFARPLLRTGTILETVDQSPFIDPEQPAFQVYAHPVAQQTLNALPFERRRSKFVRDLIPTTGDCVAGCMHAGTVNKSATTIMLRINSTRDFHFRLPMNDYTPVAAARR